MAILPHPISNLLLESLPEPLRSDLRSRLEPVSLSHAVPLVEYGTEPRFVYLMTSGLASTLTTMQTGDAVEVGLVGREGFTSSFNLLGPKSGTTRIVIQVEGSGLRMSFREFEQLFQANEPLRRLALRYIQNEAMVLAQLSACNRLHEVEERLARWLLMTDDKVGGPDFRLTQEFLADMLGTRRSTVTLTAGSLQRSGLIEYRRGHVRILDRERLEEVACECYGIVRKLGQNLYT